MSTVELVEYTKRDLKELLGDQQFWMQPRLPITKRRIISHISNPRADDSDILLITAMAKGELVAYVGVLPDLLTGDDETRTKFGWLSTWWVDKQSDSRHAATKVLFSAMKKYANRLAASSPSNDASRIYEATKRFRACATFDRTYFIMALPPKFRVISPLMKCFSAVKNRLVVGRSLRGRGLEVRTVELFDETLEAFINKWALTDPLGRDSSYWRWILEFPWLSSSAEDRSAQQRYAFSVFAPDFRQIPVVVKRSGAVIAFLVMTLREGRLCLKYAYYDAADVTDVAAALRVAITDINPWLFVSADAALNEALAKGIPFYLARRSSGTAVYAANSLDLARGSRPQFGTGDSVFT